MTNKRASAGHLLSKPESMAALRNATHDLPAVLSGDISGPQQVAGVIREARAALASAGTRPEGGDAHAAPALPSDAVGEAETPTPSPIDPLNVEEGL